MTSCSQISTELSNLSNDISVLDNKFVLKSDYTNKVNNLQQQITELANKLAAIKPVDENAIIAQAVKRSEASIVPQIAPAAAAAAAVVYHKLEPQINSAVSKAKDALEKAFNAESVANRSDSNSLAAKRQAEQSIAEAVEAKRVAKQADSKADSSINTAKTADKKATVADTTANAAKAKAQAVEVTAVDAQTKARIAQTDAKYSIGVSREASKNSELAKSIANQADFNAGKAVNKATDAISSATNAATKAGNALTKAQDAEGAVSGVRALAKSIGSKVDSLGSTINKIEKAVGEAIFKAAEAVGISRKALSTAGRALGRVLELAGAIANILSLIEQLAVLETLGARIDAVERQVDAVANSVSGILGKLLGLQRRIEAVGATVPPVRNLADRALIEGLNASNAVMRLRGRVDTAQSTADTALRKANQAQTTADGAVRNAATANTNATTAYNTAINAQNTATTAQGTANQAKGLAQRALDLGGTALNKAGQALGTALTAIALYQTLKGLKGLKGDRGLPGLPGRPGRDGLPGRNGRDGVTTTLVVQVPGQKGDKGDRGERGLRGLPGIPGRNGQDAPDMNQAQVADLKVFIAGQHQQTRGTLLGAIQQNLQLILQALGALSNAAIMGLLNIINNKLGVELPGGISGKLTRFTQWLQLDRALNLLTLAATIHNAMMLSNDIGQTLLGAINNVLQLIGLKGDDGQAFNIGTVINSTVENLIKGIIGAENYINLTEGFAKANRIYQATVNVINSFQNLTSTVLNALEITVGRIGKIGNALRKSGEVLENAYGWMNPQPKFNRITQTLENLQNGASTIQMVTQAPLDVINAITEQTEASTAFVNAIKDDGTPANITTPEPEPDILKAAEAAIREASAGKDMTEADLEADE